MEPEAYERLARGRRSWGTPAAYLLGVGGAAVLLGIVLLLAAFPYGWRYFQIAVGVGLTLHSLGMACYARRKGRSLLWILAGPTWGVGLLLLSLQSNLCAGCGKESGPRGDCPGCGAPL